MESIETRISNAILARIRSRREPTAAPESDASGPTSPAPAKIREAQFSDYQAITDLKQRWDLTPDSLENWKHLWECNPALKYVQARRPLGWVVEAEGRVVGFLGCIPSLYRFGDKTLNAIVGTSFVADPAYRAHTVRLMGAFYALKTADLYISTTAVEATGKIACAFGCQPMPQPDYETVMFWVLRPHSFVQSVLRKLEIKPAISKVAGPLAAAALAVEKLVRGRVPRPRSTNVAVTEITPAEIGEDFETLWLEELAKGTRLMADRSVEFLRWHYGLPGDLAKTCVLCARRDGRLIGYLVIRHEARREYGLRRSLVVDMIARQDDPEIISALIAAAYKNAKRAGSIVMELQGFPSGIRHLCAQWNPYTRTFPATPFYYKGATPALHKTLSDSAPWYGTPFDGDTTLMPEV